MIWLLPWDEDAGVRHMPWATWSLIALNIAAFLLTFLVTPAESEAWIPRWGLTPAEPHWYQFVTSNFVHGGPMHLVGNMLFLLVFGDNVEDAFGPVPFLLLYFIGGLAGDWMFVSANPAMMIPSVGASGCISTLAGAYLVLFFSSTIGVRVLFLVFTLHTFHIRAVWVLLFWFGADVFQTFTSHGVLPDGGGTNFVAHGAGFAFGVVAALAAAIYGVGRRYELLDDGHAWFGYWPTSLEDRPRRRRRPTVR
jgi:membrane associated rhomboid family serine protease